MLSFWPRAFIAVVLALSIGLHWTLLQTVAWASMVVTYSKDAPIKVAIEKTFDGDHPCDLCKEIQAAKKTEKKRDLKPELRKLTLLNDEGERWIFTPSSHFYFVSWPEPSSPTADSQPPAPPPRLNSFDRA